MKQRARRSRNSVLLVAAGLVLAACATPAWSSASRTWSATSREHFATGSLEGTALDVEGRIGLAPELRTLWGPGDGIVWGVAAAADGGSFAVLSGPGRLLRIGVDGAVETWYEEPDKETLVTSVAADADGGVYFGLSPSGRVLHARGPDEVEVVASTEATFVWALEVAADGTLWIGTGIPGRVLRREPGGQAMPVFDAEADPVRCLAPLADGGVVLGTGGRGRVIRVDRDLVPFVLYDAPETEVADLVVDEQGTVFALTARGSKQVATPGPQGQGPPPTVGQTVTVTARPPAENGKDSADSRGAAQQQQAPQQSFTSPAGGTLYSIRPDGTVRDVWHTNTELPFAVALTAPNRLLVATGDGGRIHMLDGDGRSTRLTRVASDQAAALALRPDGGVLIGGTTDARVELLGSSAGGSGSYLTAPIDAGTLANWGRAEWDAGDERRGVTVHARSGNTDEPDSTWSDWSIVKADAPDGGATNVPSARFLQLRVDLSSKGDDVPTVGRLDVRFRTRNRAPSVTTVNIEPPGIVWMRNASQGANRLGPFVTQDPVARKAAGTLQRKPVGALRKAYESGARTFNWQAADPDGDRLTFRLEVRREGGDRWFVLADELTESFYSWDARAMPDGLYRVRLTVDDSRDNPAGEEQNDESVSRGFTVDNTRPTVERFEVAAESEGYRVAFEARDEGGHVLAVEFALDGGDWQPIDPVDGVADSERERYELVVAQTPETGASRTIMVRVTDVGGNLGGGLRALDGPR
ncbi:MAG: hypothetical protein GY716_05070 [bacterium]|nr:hypothetical protein [bacterium]